jgi:hypothetical protein
MTRRRRATMALAALVGAAAMASPALAYVRHRTEAGQSFAWDQTCIPITAYPGNFDDVSAAQVLAAASGAASGWSAPAVSGTFLDIQVGVSTAAAPAAVYDHHNSLTFRQSWCCANADAAVAVTTLFASASTGAIRDADIEVNAEFFRWADVTADASSDARFDLQNTLTHEMGHLIGLDHPCYDPATMVERPVDNLGQPAPNCDDAPDDIRQSTMFVSTMAGELSKRSLEADDELAVREIYPLASDPMICPAVGPPPSDEYLGCRVAGGAGGAGERTAALWVMAGLVACAGRRRRRPSSNR